MPGGDLNFCSGTTPIVINNVARGLYRSHSPTSVNLPVVNSASLSAMKKRNHEKNTFSVTGGKIHNKILEYKIDQINVLQSFEIIKGLPYMLERAGLDVQHGE